MGQVFEKTIEKEAEAKIKSELRRIISIGSNGIIGAKDGEGEENDGVEPIGQKLNVTEHFFPAMKILKYDRHGNGIFPF